MAFKVGDRVVYPHHGAAIVEEKKVKTNTLISKTRELKIYSIKNVSFKI